MDKLLEAAKGYVAIVREYYGECDTNDKRLEFYINLDRLVVLHDFALFDVFTLFEWRILLRYQDEVAKVLRN